MSRLRERTTATLLIAIFMISTLITVVAGAPDVEVTTLPIVGNYYPVDVTVVDIGSAITWTFDTIGTKELVGDGHWGYGLAISLDGVEAAFQIHNNDGTDSTYDWGTHLFSPYHDGAWHSGNPDFENTPVDDLSWVTCTGDRDIADNPTGIFTVTINKDSLSGQFYWAVWFGVSGFWNPNNGYSSYPEGFIWQGTDVTSFYEEYTIPEYTYPCSPSFTGTLGDLSHGEWIHYANIYFSWPGNDLTDDSHSDWCLDRDFDGEIAGPGVPVIRPSDGATKTDEECVVYDWIGSDLEWSIRGRTLHFDEEYVPGVTRPGSTEPLVVNVILRLESKDGDEWTFTGESRTPFEVEGWPEEWKLFDYFEHKVVVDVDANEIVSYQYVQHEFYVP